MKDCGDHRDRLKIKPERWVDRKKGRAVAQDKS